MTTKQRTKRYTEWNGPAAARLRSASDLTLNIFGLDYLVKARPYDDGTEPCARIEFWRDGKHEHCLFSKPRAGFSFSVPEVG